MFHRSHPCSWRCLGAIGTFNPLYERKTAMLLTKNTPPAVVSKSRFSTINNFEPTTRKHVLPLHCDEKLTFRFGCLPEIASSGVTMYWLTCAHMERENRSDCVSLYAIYALIAANPHNLLASQSLAHGRYIHEQSSLTQGYY